jgi:uncharacterized membrane protein YphA (DoxX/SURF4 family)
MSEPEEQRNAGDADGSADADAADAQPEFKPIPPEMYRPPGGCGFTGCMYAVMIFAVVALVLLVIGLLTREWIVPVSPRG